jgi:hypothetical protein
MRIQEAQKHTDPVDPDPNADPKHFADPNLNPRPRQKASPAGVWRQFGKLAEYPLLHGRHLSTQLLRGRL